MGLQSGPGTSARLSRIASHGVSYLLQLLSYYLGSVCAPANVPGEHARSDMRPSGMATAAWGSVARQPALAASRLAVRRAGQRDTRPSLRCRDSAAAQPEVVCVGEALFGELPLTFASQARTAHLLLLHIQRFYPHVIAWMPSKHARCVQRASMHTVADN